MNEKEKRRKYKQEITQRNFRYNRFLLLRYSLAVFFFSNLYWGLALYVNQQKALLLPMSLFVLSIAAISEHVRLYGSNPKESPRLQLNHYYYGFQLLVNGFLIVWCTITSNLTQLFPFLATTLPAKFTCISVLVLGIGISIICLRRIHAINRNQDKHYQYIKAFESAYK